MGDRLTETEREMCETLSKKFQKVFLEEYNFQTTSHIYDCLTQHISVIFKGPRSVSILGRTTAHRSREVKQSRPHSLTSACNGMRVRD